MDSVQAIQAFLGWCSVINVAVLAFGAFGIVFMRGLIGPMHAAIFGLGEEDLSRAYLQWLAQYKIAVLVFNLVPYIALRLAT